MTMHAALPGWYGDGSGTGRWWNGRGWTEFPDDDAPEPLLARATLADSDEDVEMLPRHGVVAPATSLEHGPLRRGRQPVVRRHRFPAFAVLAVSGLAGTVWLGVWLMGPSVAWLIGS